MPRRQPFTALCQVAAVRPPQLGRADLHLHSTHSDGTYTPAQLVELARRCGLSAMALTDHDTVTGVAEAVAGAGGQVEVIPGTEISCEYRGKELHLLGYFFRLDDEPLRTALERLAAGRSQRFWDMVERLRGVGVSLEEGEVRAMAARGALGRRHLAELLVASRRAGTVRDAFRRYLGEGGRVALPKVRLPVAEAIRLVRAAGGVAAWAHPSYDCTPETLAELARLGLGAVEAEYPTMRPSRVRELRELARRFDLAVSGGSDCHGPEPARRGVGSGTVSAAEVEALRHRAG
jgi:hypothetical protein